MPNRYSGILALASVLFVSGCVSTSFQAAQGYNALNLNPLSPTAVRVLETPPPEGSFLLVGHIEAYLSGFPSDDTVFRKAKQRAASVGADAIMLASATALPGNANTTGAGPGEVGVTPPGQVKSVTFTAFRLLATDPSARHR